MPLWETPAPIKAAFFDADGTLLSFATHTVPDSAQMALAELKKAGVKCFLATGRAPYGCDEIPVDLLEAFILFNGQLMLTRERTLHSECLDKDDVATVVRQVEEGKYNCLFMELGRQYVSGHDDHVRAIEQLIGHEFPEGDPEEALRNDVFQLNAYLAPDETDVIKDATSTFKFTRWNENFVDVFPRHGGKARAVRRVLDMYEIRPEEAVCFGDGGNDLEMFGVVGTSVAMGNGNPEVKEQADYVTDAVDDGGILNACVKLGLI